jgi:type IV secretory pathway protease TraF
VSRTNTADSEQRSPISKPAPGLPRRIVQVLGVAVLVTLPWLRFALTPSLPRGIYFARTARPPFRPGDIVSFCPSTSIATTLLARHLVAPGICPGGSVPLAKRIVAISPHACASPEGLRLDERLYPWPRFPAALRLPRFDSCGSTPAGCAFVFGDTPDSIDSRVFGCVETSRFRDLLYPLLTERGGR